MERTIQLCIPFQLGNSFGNSKLEREDHLRIRFQLRNSFGNTHTWDYQTRKNSSLMGSVSIRQFIRECYYGKNSSCCCRFQFGNSCGNIEMNRTIHFCICFQLGKSFGNIEMQRTIHLLCIRLLKMTNDGNSCNYCFLV